MYLGPFPILNLVNYWALLAATRLRGIPIVVCALYSTVGVPGPTGKFSIWTKDRGILRTRHRGAAGFHVPASPSQGGPSRRVSTSTKKKNSLVDISRSITDCLNQPDCKFASARQGVEISRELICCCKFVLTWSPRTASYNDPSIASID